MQTIIYEPIELVNSWRKSKGLGYEEDAWDYQNNFAWEEQADNSILLNICDKL